MKKWGYSYIFLYLGTAWMLVISFTTRWLYSRVVTTSDTNVSRVRGSVTNNNGLWIG
jgi:uncharacterized membrane protein (DUF485 family)